MSATLRTTPPTTEVPATAATAQARDPWYDNAKTLLIILVVVGHSWTMLPETRVNTWVYDFLYLWHVPAFVMVTGYLSRSFTWGRTSMSRLLSTVAVPYLVFETALVVFRVGVGGENLNLLFADPHWPMWYLTALFLWRLVTPVFRRIPGAVLAAVLLCLLGGLTSGDVLDTARVMGLLPFFVVGLLTRPEHLELLRRPAARIAAVAAMAVALGVSALLDGRLSAEWLYWRSSYGELDATFLEGMGMRLILLVVGGVLAVSFFALVPARRMWFSKLGAATLVVYLFHGFVVKSAEYAGFPGWAAAHPVASLAMATPVAVVVALVLGWPQVARRLNVVVDPVGSWRRR